MSAGRAIRLAKSTEAVMADRYGMNLAAYRAARLQMGARLGAEFAKRIENGTAPADALAWLDEAVRAGDRELDERFRVCA